MHESSFETPQHPELSDNRSDSINSSNHIELLKNSALLSHIQHSIFTGFIWTLVFLFAYLNYNLFYGDLTLLFFLFLIGCGLAELKQQISEKINKNSRNAKKKRWYEFSGLHQSYKFLKRYFLRNKNKTKTKKTSISDLSKFSYLIILSATSLIYKKYSNYFMISILLAIVLVLDCAISSMFTLIYRFFNPKTITVIISVYLSIVWIVNTSFPFIALAVELLMLKDKVPDQEGFDIKNLINILNSYLMEIPTINLVTTWVFSAFDSLSICSEFGDYTINFNCMKDKLFEHFIEFQDLLEMDAGLGVGFSYFQYTLVAAFQILIGSLIWIFKLLGYLSLLFSVTFYQNEEKMKKQGKGILSNFTKLLPLSDPIKEKLEMDLQVAVQNAIFSPFQMFREQFMICYIILTLTSCAIPAIDSLVIATCVILQVTTIAPLVILFFTECLLFAQNTISRIFIIIGLVLLYYLNPKIVELIYKNKFKVNPVILYLSLSYGLYNFGILGFIYGPIIAEGTLVMYRLVSATLVDNTVYAQDVMANNFLSESHIN